MGLIGSLRPTAWLTPAIQARAGQARELHRAFVWFVFPRIQATRETLIG